jgi:hypothetical protein
MLPLWRADHGDGGQAGTDELDFVDEQGARSSMPTATSAGRGRAAAPP